MGSLLGGVDDDTDDRSIVDVGAAVFFVVLALFLVLHVGIVVATVAVPSLLSSPLPRVS